MIRDKNANTGPTIIDLTGPDGNAYALIRHKFCKAAWIRS